MLLYIHLVMPCFSEGDASCLPLLLHVANLLLLQLQGSSVSSSLSPLPLIPLITAVLKSSCTCGHGKCHDDAGLNRGFSSGIIYCSPITATLLKKDMGLPAERVIPLSVDTAHIIDGVTVTLMDANHCPGACMMLFKVATKHGKPQVLLFVRPIP